MIHLDNYMRSNKITVFTDKQFSSWTNLIKKTTQQTFDTLIRDYNDSNKQVYVMQSTV